MPDHNPSNRECAADFLIGHITDDCLYIIDASSISKNAVTVTDDAAGVVKFLYDEFDLGNRRLICQDAHKRNIEILHCAGQFLSFSPVKPGGPCLPGLDALIINQLNAMNGAELEKVWRFILAGLFRPS